MCYRGCDVAIVRQHACSAQPTIKLLRHHMAILVTPSMLTTLPH
jgi:hypothetical protein